MYQAAFVQYWLLKSLHLLKMWPIGLCWGSSNKEMSKTDSLQEPIGVGKQQSCHYIFDARILKTGFSSPSKIIASNVVRSNGKTTLPTLYASTNFKPYWANFFSASSFSRLSSGSTASVFLDSIS